VPEVRLDRAGIDSIIGQLVAAGMTKHVRVYFHALRGNYTYIEPFMHSSQGPGGGTSY
jgi:hypothetical protein